MHLPFVQKLKSAGHSHNSTTNYENTRGFVWALKTEGKIKLIVHKVQNKRLFEKPLDDNETDIGKEL